MIITVKKDQKSQRLDKFLASYFTKATKDKREFFSLGLTRGEIIRMIKSGDITVNGKKIKPNYKLKLGDKIAFPSLPPSPRLAFGLSKRAGGRGGLVLNPNLKIKIIYQDENIIAVDKPAGVSVHPVKPEENNTLVNFLISEFPEIKNIYDDSRDAYLRPGIAHRLDKDTSGVMVIARNMKAFEELKKLFKEHKVEKKYLAIVYGKLKNKSGVIDKPIARAGTYKKQVIAGRKTKTKIREAVTGFRVIREIGECSLLEVTPKTGRMHQIRVHLFSIGHPIVGDKLYKLKRVKKIEVPRQLLHAQSIKLKLFGKNYSFSSPVPSDFRKTQKSLEK